MNQQEGWQLGGTASEIYEQHLVPAIFRPWALLLIEQADLQPGERVLDVACGTGVVARLAASQVGPGGRVTAMDLNPGMLAVARTLPQDGGAPVEWSEGDATDMPLSAGVFDVICCQLGLQYFPDRPRALREMRRVVAPDGRLVLLVWRALAHSPGFAALAAALDRHVTREAGAVMRAPFVFGDDTTELRDLLAGAGFRSVRIRSDVRMVRFPSVEAFVRFQVSGSPLQRHVAQAGDIAHEALIRELEPQLRAYVNEVEVAFPIEGHVVTAHP